MDRRSQAGCFTRVTGWTLFALFGFAQAYAAPPDALHGIRIDMYWDGAEKPAVSAPIGDFFFQGLGRMATFQNALFSSPEGRSFNCCVPMPFKTGMKVVVTNESGKNLPMFFYDIDCTLGDRHPDNMLYFHAHFRRENPTKLQADYEILPRVSGRGRFLGTNIGVIPNTDRWSRAWWGEGEVKVFLDGDTDLPTLAGTGTEDYIGTGWGQGQYAQLYQGCSVADEKQFRYCFYRLHVPDPVYFRKDVRVTIQQIGYSAGHHSEDLKKKSEPVYHAGPGKKQIDFEKEKFAGLFEREDDWSSCACFYLDRPQNDLPALPPVDQRVAGLAEPKP